MSPTTTRRTADPRITTARMRAAHADIPTIRIGRRIVVPTAALLSLLGIEDAA